jgi:hypothetical protein
MDRWHLLHRILPASITARSGKEQAEYILNVWSESVQIHADCKIKQAALVEWIRAD